MRSNLINIEAVRRIVPIRLRVREYFDRDRLRSWTHPIRNIHVGVLLHVPYIWSPFLILFLIGYNRCSNIPLGKLANFKITNEVIFLFGLNLPSLGSYSVFLRLILHIHVDVSLPIVSARFR